MRPKIDTLRFRHIADDDVIYVGTAEVIDYGDERPDCGIIDCWRIGTTTDEVFPYDENFPSNIRLGLKQTILEQRMSPPAIPVVLPSDPEQFEVIDVETEYKIRMASALPRVESDVAAEAHGLSAVRRIIPGEGTYTVRAKGGLDDVRRELYRVRLF